MVSPDVSTQWWLSDICEWHYLLERRDWSLCGQPPGGCCTAWRAGTAPTGCERRSSRWAHLWGDCGPWSLGRWGWTHLCKVSISQHEHVDKTLSIIVIGIQTDPRFWYINFEENLIWQSTSTETELTRFLSLPGSGCHTTVNNMVTW